MLGIANVMANVWQPVGEYNNDHALRLETKKNGCNYGDGADNLFSHQQQFSKVFVGDRSPFFCIFYKFSSQNLRLIKGLICVWRVVQIFLKSQCYVQCSPTHVYCIVAH